MHQITDKPLVCERFQRTLGSYARHAVVQNLMAQKLTAMICREEPGRSFERTLEVGSGSGVFMAELLKRCRVKAYYANDLVGESLACLQELPERCMVEEFHFLAGDIEQQKTLPSSLDLVASNATLQWLDDLKSFFSRISAHLKAGGMLAFTTFGPSNMREIATIEDVGLSYYTPGELAILASRYFEVITIEEEEQRLEFSSPEAVLHHIRQTGVNGLCRRPWSKSRYHHFIEQYWKLFASEGGVTLTYHPVYCCLKKREP